MSKKELLKKVYDVVVSANCCISDIDMFSNMVKIASILNIELSDDDMDILKHASMNFFAYAEVNMVLYDDVKDWLV